MKNVIILFFGLFCCNSAFAQTSITPAPYEVGHWRSPSGPSYKKDTAVNDWYNWWLDYQDFAGSFGPNQFFALYPDTFLRSLQYNKDFNIEEDHRVNWCSLGQGFDPNDDAWADQNLAKLGRKVGFYADSAYVGYGYFRANPDTLVVDTLLIQVYLSQKNQLTEGVFNIDKSIFSVPTMDRKRSAGRNFSYEAKIPLHLNHSCDLESDGSFIPKLLRFNLDTGSGIWIDSNEYLHLTTTFIPGQKYSFGDTLYFDEELYKLNKKAPKYKLNRFGVMVSPQTPRPTALTSYNNASFITNWIRYQDPASTPIFLKGKYWPNRFSNGWNSQVHYFPHIGFHVNGKLPKPVSTSEADFLDFKLFPNPANNSLTIQFSSAQELNDVRMAVLDLQGRELISLFKGNLDAPEFSWVFDVSGLQSGVYLVKVNVDGNEVTTEKFIKH